MKPSRGFVRNVWHQLAPPVATRLWRGLRQARARDAYARGFALPWSAPYLLHRESFIRRTLDAMDLTVAFRGSGPLPAGFGIGLDERCVEYPWVLSRLSPGSGRVLDAGSALNHGFLLARPELRSKTLHILTLAPERESHRRKGISYLYADLRDIPVRNGYYDLVISISTLEHIGFDNAQFTGVKAAEIDAGSCWTALRELRRVLRPGGHLLLTLPYGEPRPATTYQLFDEAKIGELIALFGGECEESAYYRYSSGGWNAATAEACKDAEYVPWIMTPERDRPVEFPLQPDKATAARAVVCLKLKKP